jgi:signal transduction histidine kinase
MLEGTYFGQLWMCALDHRGFCPEELPHIFMRYHRVGPSERFINGLGIGLYLVHDVITRHGGRVWVESTEGIGSTFFVALPLNLANHK